MDKVAITLSDNSFQTIMQSIYFLFDIIKNSYEDPSHPTTIVLVTSILIMYRASLGLEYWQKKSPAHKLSQVSARNPLFWFTKRHIFSRSNKHFHVRQICERSRQRSRQRHQARFLGHKTLKTSFPPSSSENACEIYLGSNYTAHVSRLFL